MYAVKFFCCKSLPEQNPFYFSWDSLSTFAAENLLTYPLSFYFHVTKISVFIQVEKIQLILFYSVHCSKFLQVI